MHSAAIIDLREGPLIVLAPNIGGLSTVLQNHWKDAERDTVDQSTQRFATFAEKRVPYFRDGLFGYHGTGDTADASTIHGWPESQ
jgi:hypothetical protein